MNGNQRFTELLDIYLAGKASTAENHLLMRMIKSGDYDDLLRKKIDEAMINNDSSATLDASRSYELLYKILNSEKHTAELIPSMKRASRYRRVGMAVAAMAAIFLVVWGIIPRKNTNGVQLSETNGKPAQTVADKKEKQYVKLPDGSTVFLKAGSTIQVPEGFGSVTRDVVLTGEAYFDIHHDAKKPFIVHTGNVSTTVLGTAFNVKAWPTQKEISVTVTRGKVKVSNKEKTLGVITPNESITVNLNDDSYSQQTVNAEKIVEWKKQYLVFDDISMEDAAELIDSKYNVHVSFTNEATRHCRISATFLNNESLEQVLTVVTAIVEADYTIQPNDQVIINGDGCK